MGILETDFERILGVPFFPFVKIKGGLNTGTLNTFWCKFWQFIQKYLSQILLICHKNKWRDLSQKFVTSFFKTMFLFIEGGQENIFIGPKNIFDQ